MIYEFGEDFRYKLRRFRDANLPLFHVDESRMMKKYRQVKEANYALYRVLNKEKIEDHHFLFRETLEEYIDNIGVGHFEDNARWLEVISSGILMKMIGWLMWKKLRITLSSTILP